MILSSTRRVITATLIGALSIGCGGGSNNDQGGTFTLSGFAAYGDDGCETEQGLAGVSLPISGGNSGENPGSTESLALVCATLTNQIRSRSVAVSNAFIEYYVPGATEQPPSTSTAISGSVLGPSGGVTPITQDPTIFQPGNPPPTTLPPTYTGENTVRSPFLIIPPSVTQWIALNRQNLPEPPFEMNAIVTVIGRTSGGDQIESNPNSLLIEVVPDNYIRPGAEDDEEDDN